MSYESDPDISMANQRHRDNHALLTSDPSIISREQNGQQSKEPMMLAQQHQQRSSPPTNNDQYHHSETIWRVLIDIISLIILLVATVISHYIAQPFTRGFFCSDTSIQYPIKSDTIPTYADVILSVALPLVWMWITEFCKRSYFAWYPKQPFRTRLELCGTRIANITPFIRNLYVLTVIFLYGYLATWVLTEIAKNFVGELRPHFIALCRPSYNCSAATTQSQFNTYLQYNIDYTCTNTDDTAVREGRRAFFSGHASSIFYGCGWLIMYIHVSWSWRHLGILGQLFQIGLAVLAFYIGYSRISDFQHHWHDVLVGGIVGSLVAFAAFRFILNWRHYNPRFLPYTASAFAAVPNQNSSAAIAPNRSTSNRRVTPQNKGRDQDLHF